jgi:hypothetical protein
MNVSCVGLQVVMANRHEYKNYAQFYKDFKWRFLKISKIKNDLEIVQYILDKMEMHVKSHVIYWKQAGRDQGDVQAILTCELLQ